MKKLIKLLAATLFVIAPFSCKDSFLDTEPVDRVTTELTWEDGALARAFVFGVYQSLGYGGFEEQMLAAYTDEAMFTHAGRNINTFNEATESPSKPAWSSNTYAWTPMYEAIRAANIAIQRLPEHEYLEVDRDMLLGEAYFLRAYYYHQLVRYYGGVPLITNVYELNEDYSIARSSWEDCVNLIVADLDKAIELLAGKLDGSSVVPGRASKLAAQALKARVLLYAASDLHDAATASAKAPGSIGAFANKELVAYTSGDRLARWTAARDAAKVVMDAMTGYKMDLTAPVTPEEGEKNYVALSMSGGSNAADVNARIEQIFVRTETPLYTRENDWPLGGIHFGINNGPNGYHNWAGNTPIQQLVDDYEMMDGSRFDWENDTHAADPYANRDPRFYATVLFDGAPWKPRPADVAKLDPNDEIQTGYYEDGDEGTINGLDTRESVIENWNGSRTHYYQRKFIDPDPEVVEDQSNAQVVPWPFIRYTEVVLNYIEASIELGEEAEAKAWLNKIRYRAGMPEITDTGDALRDRYRNERRVELAFEEHRYHDARRWMIAPETLGRGIKSINIRATVKAGQTALSPYRHDKSVYDYEYTVEDNTSNETRKWDDKMYFRPIVRDEMNRNTKLVQNPGYTD